MRNSLNQPSQRQLRVGEQIKHVIAEMLARGEIAGGDAVTITEVRVTPDLKLAIAYVVGQDVEKLLPELTTMAHSFQKEVARQTQLKFTPKISFKVDDSFDKALRLDSIINNLKYSDQE